jgi:hypothetical protein
MLDLAYGLTETLVIEFLIFPVQNW